LTRLLAGAMGGEANALSPHAGRPGESPNLVKPPESAAAKRDFDTRQHLLFVQGAGDMWAPDGSGVLVKYLEKSLGTDFDIVAPEMPDADTDPHYLPWRDRIDAELQAMNGAVVLVGHSFGASVLLKYLAEGPPPRPISGLFLLSTPWWEPEGWSAEYAVPDDVGSKLPPAVPIFLYHSREDPEVPFSHLALYEQLLRNATSRPIDGSNHSFTDGLPELITDIRQVVASSS